MNELTPHSQVSFDCDSSEAESKQTPPTNDHENEKQETDLDLGRVAKTVRRRTTDVIAIVLVVMLGLTAGRQLLQWSKTQSTPDVPLSHPAVPSFENWGSIENPVQMQFGRSNLLVTRQMLAGTEAEISQQVIELTERNLKQSPIPKSAISSFERRILDSLQDSEPVHSDEDGGHVYQTANHWSLTLGLRDVSPTQKSSMGAESSILVRRLVCWTIVSPHSEQHWSVYTFRRHSENHDTSATTASSGDFSQMLPEGCFLLMNVRDSQGNGLAAFEGQGDARIWQTEFNRNFDKRNFEILRNWCNNDRGSSVVYRKRDDNGELWYEVQIDESSSPNLSGLISTTRTLTTKTQSRTTEQIPIRRRDSRTEKSL